MIPSWRIVACSAPPDQCAIYRFDYPLSTSSLQQEFGPAIAGAAQSQTITQAALQDLASKIWVDPTRERN